MKQLFSIPLRLSVFICVFMSVTASAQKSIHLIPLKKEQVKVSSKISRIFKTQSFSKDSLLYYTHQGLRSTLTWGGVYQLTEDNGVQSVALTTDKYKSCKIERRKEEVPPRSKFSLFRLFQPKKKSFSVYIPKDTMILSQSGIRSFQENAAQYTLILTALKYKNLGKRNIDFRNKTKAELHYVLVDQKGKIITKYKYVQYFHFETEMRKEVVRHYAKSVGKEGAAQALSWIK